MIGYWKDKDARRVWRWILLIYSLVALALALYGTFTFRTDFILSAIFLTSAILLIRASVLQSRILWAVLVLLLLPALPYGVVYACHSADAMAARKRSEFRVLGIPLILIRDGELTPYYRDYIRNDLPDPMWYPCFKSQIGFGAPHTDYFTQGIATADYMLGSVMKQYNPTDVIKEEIVKAYFTLLHRQSENSTALAATLTSQYAIAVEKVFMQKTGEVRSEDLPNIEDIRREFEEMRPEGSQ